MGGASPEARPPGGARGSLRGRKGQALTLLPARAPPVPSPPSWAPGWTRARRTSVSPRLPLPQAAATQHAQLQPGAPRSPSPSAAGVGGPRRGRAGGGGGWRDTGGAETGLRQPVWGPLSGTAVWRFWHGRRDVLRLWKAGSGTSCSLTATQDVEPPPAAALAQPADLDPGGRSSSRWSGSRSRRRPAASGRAREQEHQGCTAAAPGPEETPTPPGPTNPAQRPVHPVPAPQTSSPLPVVSLFPVLLFHFLSFMVSFVFLVSILIGE